jgi:hypothetical protein
MQTCKFEHFTDPFKHFKGNFTFPVFVIIIQIP